MILDQILSAPRGTVLIARNGLSARQWELELSEALAPSSVSTSVSRPLVGIDGWLSHCFERASELGLSGDRLLLGFDQTERLWRQVIEASDDAAELIDSGKVTRWARLARRRLLEHGFSRESAARFDATDDFGKFLRWQQRFDALLEERGWVDREALIDSVARLDAGRIGQDLLLLEPMRDYPALDRLLEGFRQQGHAVTAVEPGSVAADLTGLRVPNPETELELAADWAANQLEARPGQRLAIVVPDLGARRFDVETLFGERLGPERVWIAEPQRLSDRAIFGAALTAIRLLAPGSDFGTLSRWLRSPFFGAADAGALGAAAGLELRLRESPAAQHDFARAWQSLSLKAPIQKHAPEAARALSAALDRLPNRATPTAWTTAWQDCLKTLGWHGFGAQLPQRLRTAWDEAWARFAQLTPIVGSVAPNDAVAMLDETLATATVYEPIPASGVLLVSEIGDVGPGCTGCWITGATDQRLPAPPTPNPFVPYRMQQQLGFSEANPAQWLEASRIELENLRRRVDVVVASAALREQDQPQVPSPYIANWSSALPGLAAARPPRGARARIGKRKWARRNDAPPALAGNRIPGGARTLNLQAACPVKALITGRLRAEPLELPVSGIDARLRGILLHAALELAAPAEEREPLAVADAVAAAIDKLAPRGDAVWSMQVRAERARMTHLITGFLDQEGRRGGFATVAVEQRTAIEIGPWSLTCRVDRIDRLESGSLVVIDYKTGRLAPRWFDARLGDCQLPLYAQAGDVAAILAVRLGADAIEYRAAGVQGTAIPGLRQRFEAAEWRSQREHWRDQITGLLEEFAAGDARVPVGAEDHVRSDRGEHAGGAYAASTRVGDRS